MEKSVSIVILTVVLLACLINKCQCASISSQLEAIEYLERNGFKNKTADDDPSNLLRSSSSLEEFFQAFQKMFNLPQTGRLDDATRSLMNQPQCQNSAKPVAAGMSAESVQKWNIEKLTYRIESFPDNIAEDDVRSTIAKAYKEWSSVIPIDFEEVTNGKADIIVKFVSGQHQGYDRSGNRIDHGSFDGRGAVLAHAFFPDNGDTCFDADDDWAISSSDGKNLMQTSLHEFGHALGLDHINDGISIMHKYHDNRDNPHLTSSDIAAAQSIYGKRGQVMEIFDLPKFEGQSFKVTFQPGHCHDLDKMRDRVSSINTWGDCVELFFNQNCAGPSRKIFPGAPFPHDELEKVKFEDSDKVLGNNARSYRACTV